jgi:hypothetical protein
MDDAETARGRGSGSGSGGKEKGSCSEQIDEELEPLPAATPSTSHGPPPAPVHHGACSLWTDAALNLVALVRATSGLLLFGMFDVVPLWLAASRGAGGLALDEKQLGVTLAVASLVMLPWVVQPQGR